MYDNLPTPAQNNGLCACDNDRMANERKTEEIVRNHLRKFKDVLVVEEQASDNPKIKKLLKTASKSGSGSGYPEFIVQIKDSPDLVIVVECKASPSKHESKSKDLPKDFAVDGVLLYSSYLAKEFDVISIAVSGETRNKLKISHFLQLKGANSATSIFSDQFLSPEAYIEGYIKSPEKLRQDYESLILFSRNLNKKLHKHKILGSDRSLLISCVLIALENKAFQKSYRAYSRPEDLAKYLVNTVEMEFKNSGIQDTKLNIVKSRFEFIRTDTSLSKKEDVLMEVITDINENINKFVKTHEYFDVLSQLYVEFLRYANSDKGLGIVLTPHHITEFMAELGEVNKNSVVYDSCTGTGGFLVNAMNVMIRDAKGDLSKIKSIKQSQLIGVEYQANIFALACSNMFIHQDGKTNLLNGSCFDDDIVKQVMEKRPTVGLLNPPYKADKDDEEELEFVLNNLSALEQGGRCVAIVPLNSGLALSGIVYDLKKKLLEKHTLEAVLSMPNELFANSKVAVVSCIMVFTAKRPHPSGKKTFLGYFKDDGFVKRKNKGRIDLFGDWESIKTRWINAYMNKEEIPLLSVNRVVTADDEWCAEAFLETDYTGLSEDDFIEEVKKYLAFRLQN